MLVLLLYWPLGLVLLCKLCDVSLLYLLWCGQVIKGCACCIVVLLLHLAVAAAVVAWRKGATGRGDTRAGTECHWSSYSLPTTAVPQSYRLLIDAQLVPPRKVQSYYI